MFIEQLEDRTHLAHANFNKNVVYLQPGKEYIITKPLVLRSNQKIICKSSTNIPTIVFIKRGSNVVVMPENSHGIVIRNVRFRGSKKAPAIRVSGYNQYIGNVRVSTWTGSAVIVDHARNVVIENCNQSSFTRMGFIYGANFKNLTIRNVSTCGNLYENDLRFHAFDGLYIRNVRIDADNPECRKLLGKAFKANALRIHDGSNAVVDGFTASGTTTLGVMDENNGGLGDLRSGRVKEYRRKMGLRSRVVFENARIYGNLVLATNLSFRIRNLGMVSWRRGACISVNPQYGPFRNGGGLYRKPAAGSLYNVTAKYTADPGVRNLSSLIKKFSSGVRIVHGKLLSSFYRGIDGSRLVFNKKRV